LKFFPVRVPRSIVTKPVAGAIVGLMAFGAVWGGTASAEPAHDSAANIKELSRQAEELAETINITQADFDKKLQLVNEADRKNAADLAALEAARAQLVGHQGAVNRLAAAVYMGGRTDGLNTILTAASPTNLIDKLTIQRVMGTEMAEQMRGFRQTNQEARVIQAASAESAAAAKVALDEAVVLRADLQRQQSELQEQITQAAVNYVMLPPAEQAVLAGPDGMPPAVMAAVSRVAPIPTVGMTGLVPNARGIVQYIMATYPGVQSIGGVRADPLPDHPSGRAVDIMIGSNMALGDAIHADLQSQAARFGISYTMWRVSAHFDHIHVTVF